MVLPILKNIQIYILTINFCYVINDSSLSLLAGKDLRGTFMTFLKILDSRLIFLIPKMVYILLKTVVLPLRSEQSLLRF